jgi:hypothetical protein
VKPADPLRCSRKAISDIHLQYPFIHVLFLSQKKTTFLS